ncbi:formyl-CoA transferase [Devosia subaequoris]|uniref:Formyl-CoA transferase n=1 Tax=Devosia subaequoris TaxID=395930 RepID=A0A7W6IN86_9HYPH|nr:CoA transferase [Devosia subaequoris]MBB4052105.1 formyl-CoA transferase [Devosia subaequoris]MCP1210268.1 CoA transferase [Devosia subaequoris]
MSERAANASHHEEPDSLPPLTGLRVLDLSQVMAGPFCCMLLGDMGADVIKVEPPETGDQTRKSMGFRMKGEDSPGFLALNRNKRSITLNLKTPEGQNILHKLVETADILVENSRPGVSKKLGADYETLSRINPRLIYASISGFGQTGPWSQRPGFDLIAQAMGGIISGTGIPGAEPVKSGIPVGDLGAGMFASYGILSAVIGRERTGKGQYIDTSLLDAALALSVWESTEYWATGKSPGPLGTANRMSAPYQAFAGSDGNFVVGAANQKLWLIFCDVIGRPELKEDPRYANNIDRVQRRSELADELKPTFLARPAEEWVEKFLEAGVPAGPINDYSVALDNEHVHHRKAVIEIEHPVEGSFKALGFPAKLSHTPAAVRRPPPLLGQHTDEILSELGLLDEQNHKAIPV